jgi:membrane protease subunit HflK
MPGLHFKIPFIDTIHFVKVDYQYKMEFGFRTVKSGVRTQYSSKTFKNESWMLTGDLKIAEVHWVVQYKIKDAFAYLFNVKNVENTIKDVSEATMRAMVGDRSFSEAVQAERRNIGDSARENMQLLLDEYGTGISVEMVQLQSVVPPEPVADSFNEVNRAKQDQETMINNARQEYNKQIYRVEGEAERIINEANGYAIERINEAKGNTSLFEAVLVEYKKSPQITRDRLYIEAMKEVLTDIPNKIIVDSDLENLLPLLNLNSKGGK